MKEKVKSILNKINFKKLTIALIVLFVISIWISIYINLKIGLFIISGTMTGMLIDFGLYSLKKIIDDIENMIGVFIVVAWFILVITLYGKLANFIIPKFFSENTDKMYELYFSAFGSLVSAFIGVGATYFGAVYAGKKALEAVQKQLDKQETDNINKNLENKKTVIRIITKFLKEELIDNRKVIDENHIFEYLSKGFKTQYGYDQNKIKIKLDDYNQIKYELVKYCEEALVEEVIDVYELFYILLRYNDLIQLNEKEYNKIKFLKSKLDNLIDKIDSFLENDKILK
jgi:hypothetical protein